jgi:hypothetical protein
MFYETPLDVRMVKDNTNYYTSGDGELKGDEPG